MDELVKQLEQKLHELKQGFHQLPQWASELPAEQLYMAVAVVLLTTLVLILCK